MPVIVGASGTGTEGKSDRLGIATGTSDPGSASVGDMYYKTDTKTVRVYDGTAWGDLAASDGPGDPDYDDVVLHLTFDAGMEDNSRFGQLATGTRANVTASGSKFGNSCRLEASQDDQSHYIEIRKAASLNFGTGNFTMEGWLYLDGDDTHVDMNGRVFQLGVNSTSGYALIYNGSTIYFGRTDEQFVSDSRSNWNNAWHHFAIQRNGSTVRFFRDGTLVSTSTTSNASWNNSLASDHLYFGIYPGDTASPRSNIRIDEIRFTKKARYATAGFSAPTSKFPRHKVTSLGTRENPASNANAIYAADSNAASGTYFISMGASGINRTYCEFNSFGGWMLLAQGAKGVVPTGSNNSEFGTLVIGGNNVGRFSDTVINNCDWSYVWMGMTDNNSDQHGHYDGNNTMDPGRQLFTTSGNKFTVAFNTQNSTLTSGSTENGRNQVWSHKGPGGSSGSSLTGSPRQPSSSVINGAGNTDYQINNTNTYGISPHDAGIGGAWIWDGNGGDGGGNFNNGFDQDYNNVPWDDRYYYWFFK